MTLDAPTPAEALLVDPRFGLLTAVRPDPYPEMPAAWVGYGAAVADTRQFTDWHADPFGFGAAVGDPDRARRAAIGEAVERYCGRVVPPDLFRGSWRQWGENALDPETFALYSDRQYATPGFPFVPFGRDTEAEWVEGRDLRDHSPVLVPATSVYLDYRPPGRRPLHALSYAGIAAGTDREHAERFALEELFERDATTIWWASGAPAELVADGYRVVDLLDDRHADRRRVRLLRVPSPFGVPVLCAFIEDADRGLVAFGSACRADPVEAGLKALVEALGLLQMTAQLADPDSELWSARQRGTILPHTFVAFRADRRYSESFRADYRDLVDLPALAQLYLDPRMQGSPLERLRPESPRIALADIPRIADPYESYLAKLTDAGHRIVSVDVTTPDVRAAGLCVVRVVVPGLYGNAPAAFPYLGGRRLYEVPVDAGWIDRPLTEDTLVRDPLPLA
ncbi:YcaO-like family protein [Cryptosporangium arvum]|uniref:Bacteriocin biosynthesis docking scaffold, SagD family n=1 Tax=Cryptosporangium arvum DSM 44712 TaxID=927661 RepID=A0A011AEN6_9ACTN|nr:YcaO-like family protein [Cryptosporangium arvum]EXG80501.1 bacteriocin biosynthesis docking scaffold, SagD family [Cryptosporangium arvum DSM 44712]